MIGECFTLPWSDDGLVLVGGMMFHSPLERRKKSVFVFNRGFFFLFFFFVRKISVSFRIMGASG